DEASAAAGQQATAVGTITHMCTERLVRLLGSDDRQLVDTYHDKIRETVLDQLDEPERRQLHGSIGQTIESKDKVLFDDLWKTLDKRESEPTATPPRVFDLAYHFSEAG
ncbi:MAG: hypothetical protein GTO41_07035, partial [Burkholderiales bacterium]|nr:hypothetical protein [Burkholderiales bacterium]